jgi:hypothetical protein
VRSLPTHRIQKTAVLIFIPLMFRRFMVLRHRRG